MDGAWELIWRQLNRKRPIAISWGEKISPIRVYCNLGYKLYKFNGDVVTAASVSDYILRINL